MFDPDALAKKSAELETATPEQILAFAFETWPKIAISTAFGVEGCALVDMAVRLQPDVQVFTVDTDYLFAETLVLRDIQGLSYREIASTLITSAARARDFAGEDRSSCGLAAILLQLPCG